MDKYLQNSIFFLVVFIISCLGCSTSTNTQIQKESKVQNESSQIIPKPQDEKSKSEIEFADNFFANKEYKGCWSSTNGLILEIGENKIKLSTNSFKPVNYLKVDKPLKKSGVSLQIIDRPQFYYFSEYIFIQVRKDDDDTLMRVKFYSTYDDFLKNNSSGYSGLWVRESDCKKFF